MTIESTNMGRSPTLEILNIQAGSSFHKLTNNKGVNVLDKHLHKLIKVIVDDTSLQDNRSNAVVQEFPASVYCRCPRELSVLLSFHPNISILLFD